MRALDFIRRNRHLKHKYNVLIEIQKGKGRRKDPGFGTAYRGSGSYDSSQFQIRTDPDTKTSLMDTEITKNISELSMLSESYEKLKLLFLYYKQWIGYRYLVVHVDHGRFEPHNESGLVKLAKIGDDRHVLVQQLQQKKHFNININQSINCQPLSQWIKLRSELFKCSKIVIIKYFTRGKTSFLLTKIFQNHIL